MADTNIRITAEDAASSVIERVGNSVSFFTDMLKMAAGIEILSGIKEAASSLVSFQSNLEQTTIAFKTFLGSADASGAMIDDLYKLAATTPFRFKDVEDGSKKLMAFGWAAKDILPTLTAVGDATAGLGGTGEMMNRVVRALGQIKAKGKVQGDEMLQLAEAGIPAYQILGDKLGLTGDQIANIGKQGIKADEAIKALTEGMEERFGGMMAAQAESWSGMLSTIKDNSVLLGTYLTKNVFSLMRSQIESIRNLTNDLYEPLQKEGAQGLFRSHIKDKDGKVVERTDQNSDEVDKKLMNGDLEEKGPAISDTWQSRIAVVVDSINTLWNSASKVFTSLGTLFNDVFGSNQGFESFVQIVTTAADVVLILANFIINIADAFVNFTNAILGFNGIGTALTAILTGMVAGFVALGVIRTYESSMKMAAAATTFFDGAVGGAVLKIGLLAAGAYLVYSTWSPLTAVITAVGLAWAAYTYRAEIAAVATAAVATVNGIISGTMALVQGVVVGATVVWGLLNMVLEGYSIRTVAVAAVTALVEGAMAAVSAVVTIAGVAWAAVTAFIDGFSISTALATVATVAYEAVMALVTGTVALASAAFAAVTFVIDFFTMSVDLATIATSLLDGAIAILESPILLVVAAIGLLAYAVYEIYENWDALSAYAVEMWDGLCNTIGGAVDWLLSCFQEFCPSMYNMICEAFNAVGSTVSNIWNNIASTIWAQVTEFVNGILARLGPLGKMIKSVGSSIADAAGSLWEMGKGAAGTFTSWVSEKTGLGYDENKGRAELAAHQGSGMSNDDDGGKDKKGKKGRDTASKIESETNKITNMIANYDAKISGIVDDKPTQELKKLDAEIAKSRQELAKAAELGIDTSAAEAKLEEYKEVATKKVKDDLLQAQREFAADTDAITAKVANDKQAIAKAEYDKTLASIDKEQKEKKLAGMDEVTLAKYVAAKKEEADRTYYDACAKNRQDELMKIVEHNNNLVALGKMESAQADKVNRDKLNAYINELQTQIDRKKKNNEETLDLEKQQADAQKQIHEANARDISTAYDEAMRQLKGTTHDYAKDIVDAYNDIFDSFTSNITKMVQGTQSFSESMQNIISDMKNRILQMFVEMWANEVIYKPMQSLFGSLIKGSVGAMSGSGSSTGTSLTAVDTGSDYGYSFLSGIDGLAADGGTFGSGDTYIVGEKGPEIVKFDRPGSVIPNQTIRDFANGAGAASNSSGGGTSPTIPTPIVNIENKSGTDVTGTASTSFDGSKMIVSVVLDAVKRNVGGLRTVLGGIQTGRA